MTLAGTGDFDGDNRQEFVWQTAEGQLHIGHPSDSLAAIAGAADLAIAAGGRMLTVADVDGTIATTCSWSTQPVRFRSHSCGSMRRPISTSISMRERDCPRSR